MDTRNLQSMTNIITFSCTTTYTYQSTSKSFVEFPKNITELQIHKMKTTISTRIVHTKPGSFQFRVRRLYYLWYCNIVRYVVLTVTSLLLNSFIYPSLSMVVLNSTLLTV